MMNGHKREMTGNQNTGLFLKNKLCNYVLKPDKLIRRQARWHDKISILCHNYGIYLSVFNEVFMNYFTRMDSFFY